jgi:hypothetical protein
MIVAILKFPLIPLPIKEAIVPSIVVADETPEGFPLIPLPIKEAISMIILILRA